MPVRLQRGMSYVEIPTGHTPMVEQQPMEKVLVRLLSIACQLPLKKRLAGRQTLTIGESET
jgi:hypothetical protein